MIEPKLELDPVWKRPFELAWESLRAGSFPVGAVIVNASGEVVAEGRNRIYERAGPAGQLAGTSLAHAEINALAQLPDGRYGDYLLRTTLAPCILCTSALRMARIGEVHFAANDRVWDGMQQLPQMLSKNAARYWTVRRGPTEGISQTLGGVLPALWHLKVRPAFIPELEIPDGLSELSRRLQADGVRNAEDVDDVITAVQKYYDPPA